ncbi:NADH:ubiquinone reductase (Na(+)-transporting) subunit F [Serpentinicella alkaliphila]|uniref:Na+-transporting NADH:ubiquinone oxidoreductase subunit F n=1 Tax=Serpentinicella alkaliphila TaxID=1734049 RepID=A0A4R2UBW6_9FIRM|nr:2Fe-2S iron-sulfur cluster binding domain-containing protein [Serpentinicella alkaliphila]QUH27086.1 2Fe-2S iron-sulfur cluster binding domain-containing protein [Serpentinicella alkaliphila]TCQ05213.1 Na+-transporting NADH:ubiquinone oxidoreductase subunit F [Serpentinicella alkaliphila]
MSSIFVTVFIITTIATVLALLLTLANYYIADYGERKIVINNDKELYVEGGTTLLSSLISNEIFIPSACGGKGNCGYCKCKVEEGGGPILATELSYLSEDDKNCNIRLSCQVKVKENMKIEIPEELFNVKQYNVVVEFARDVTPTIKYLRLAICEDKEIQFRAGQYIQLLAPPYADSNEDVFRAYSIASQSTTNKYIELLIGYVPDGIVTTYVHKHLTKGDKVTFNGPYGDFYLSDSDCDIVLVAVGTGMAPIRSILLDIKDKKISRNVIFFFGARTEDDLFMIDEMKRLEEELPQFTFVPTLSRPDKNSWNGEVGRVTDMIDKYLEYKEGREAYLCGNGPMIKSTVNHLIDKGFSEDNIYYDSFD